MIGALPFGGTALRYGFTLDTRLHLADLVHALEANGKRRIVRVALLSLGVVAGVADHAAAIQNGLYVGAVRRAGRSRRGRIEPRRGQANDAIPRILRIMV